VVVAKVWERLEVSKQAARKLDVERFNLWKLSKLEVWKQYQINISKRTEALENLSDSKDINTASENTKENIKISARACIY
jgi:hypothetical protein